MKSLDREFLEQQAIPLEFAGTMRLLGEYRGKQELYTRQTPQVLNTLRQVAIIQSVESSNRIEGVIVDEKRLKPLLEKGTTPANRSEAEVMGYKDVLSRIHTTYERFSITPETILKIHRDMLSRTDLPAGEWKRRDNTIEESKESYYEVLNRVSENWKEGRHSIIPWWEYSLGILIAAYREFENRVGIIRSSRGAKTAWVREAIEHLPEEFGVGDLANICSGVSRPMIRVILEALRAEGKLEVFGTGRGAKWRKR